MSVRVLVDGMGDIAEDVVWAETELHTAAQGEASESTIVLRNIGGSPTSVVTGKRIRVDLGPGTPTIYGGYVLRSSRQFWFPVDNPQKLQRRWVLTLGDNNILFSRRVVFHKDDPRDSGVIVGQTDDGVLTTVSVPGFSRCRPFHIDVWDDEVVALLVSDWLDLSLDDIDTTSRVERVASIYYGQPVQPWSGGDTWGDAMKQIAQLPAAIFYLDPDWALVYADVDHKTAPFVLTDQPGPDDAGYREATIWDDATKMANDGFAWGSAKGEDRYVFSRTTDGASIAEHGLWQDGANKASIWCQSTIDKVSSSMVIGSPTSRRGRRNEIRRVELVTHVDGFRVGQGVRFVSHEYDVDDVIPIRKMTVKFETPDVVRYELTLSHEYDWWGLEDPPVPDLPITGTRTPQIEIPCLPALDPGVWSSPAVHEGDSSGLSTGELWIHFPEWSASATDDVNGTGWIAAGNPSQSLPSAFTLTAGLNFDAYQYPNVERDTWFSRYIYTIRLTNILGAYREVQAEFNSNPYSDHRGTFSLSDGTTTVDSSSSFPWWWGPGTHRLNMSFTPDRVFVVLDETLGLHLPAFELSDGPVQISLRIERAIGEGAAATVLLDHVPVHLGVSDLLLNGKPVPVSPCMGPPGEGAFFCEQVTMDGPVAYLSKAYVSGTVQIVANGIQLRGGSPADGYAGTVDFWEISPALGAIGFREPLTGTIEICYFIGPWLPGGDGGGEGGVGCPSCNGGYDCTTGPFYIPDGLRALVTFSLDAYAQPDPAYFGWFGIDYTKTPTIPEIQTRVPINPTAIEDPNGSLSNFGSVGSTLVYGDPTDKTGKRSGWLLTDPAPFGGGPYPNLLYLRFHTSVWTAFRIPHLAANACVLLVKL